MFNGLQTIAPASYPDPEPRPQTYIPIWEGS